MRTLSLASILFLLLILEVAAVDYYKVLDVSRDASDQEIKKAYRKLSHKWHPDRATTESQRKIHHEKMIEVNKAFEVLSDSEKRHMYNTYGTDMPSNGGGGGFPGARVRMEDVFNHFGDIPFFEFQNDNRGSAGGRRQNCYTQTTCRGPVCTTRTVCT